MHKFGKVVLSRKGFDSSAGGDYSPFDPQTGKYVVLPIPDGEIGKNIGNRTRYEQIKIEPNYLPGIDAETLKDLINSKALGFGNKVKEGITKKYAHFDPWLGPCPWLAEGSNHQVGAFGQVDSAQAQLQNQGVDKGSLFLFFSRFKPIGKNSEKMIVTDISPEHLDGGLYFIYGWLKVKKVIQQYEDIDDQSLRSRHPHATKKYFEMHAHKKKGKNTLYIADDFLFNDGSNLPGCGYFPRLNKDLLLTASAQETETWIPSRWRLPGFLYEKCLSVMKGKGRLCNDDSGSYLVKTSGRWQEAVFEESEEFCQWFYRLLESIADNV
ncbi:MAG: hypothetical protein FJ023_01475 [Chloroflexi bacterium]|nr:hypothetical protein [Chloroflexota bacterium]